ncbi:MAG: MogA/MoaB family molybdenum cofactor biosynthesis protein [Armatimonadota bacterium]|nr:MogA/MoaB family molybdenum cofactor biosynthesis protein [Armatimonadota bacterium]MDR5696332.1 MogA/MoaB family molybdenum cofactor biosynthesis protein [Armatimonadota bacterium]
MEGTPSVHAHHQAARGPVGCAVLTISDTRTPETDTGGQLIVDLLRSCGHLVVRRGIVRDEPEQIEHWIRTAAQDPRVQVILTTGGTGISPRDNTYEVVSRMIERRLDGFGELFRMLSYQEVGPAAMLSRAVGGTVAGRVVLCMPGSPDAVRLAMDRLVLPEIEHLAWQTARG